VVLSCVVVTPSFNGSIAIESIARLTSGKKPA
jgi:hypothetical protein